MLGGLDCRQNLELGAIAFSNARSHSTKYQEAKLGKKSEKMHTSQQNIGSDSTTRIKGKQKGRQQLMQTAMPQSRMCHFLCHWVNQAEQAKNQPMPRLCDPSVCGVNDCCNISVTVPLFSVSGGLDQEMPFGFSPISFEMVDCLLPSCSLTHVHLHFLLLLQCHRCDSSHFFIFSCILCEIA